MLIEHLFQIIPNLTNRKLDLILRSLLNCIGPSPVDKNDFMHTAVETKRREMNWVPWTRIIEDQGVTQSCVAQGNESMIQVPINIVRGVNNKKPEGLIDLDAMGHFKVICDTYYEGNQKKGAYPRDGLLVLKNVGITELYPNEGIVHRIKKFWRCFDLVQAENSIVTTGPLVAALRIHRSFYDCTGEVQMPGKKFDFVVGYHQIALLRRLCKNKVWGWTIRNSWGPSWGDYGHAFISDEVLDEIAVEIWGSQYDLSMDQLVSLAERMIPICEIDTSN